MEAAGGEGDVGRKGRSVVGDGMGRRESEGDDPRVYNEIHATHKRMSKSRLEALQPKRGTEVRTPTQRTNPTGIFALFFIIALDITFFG